MRKRTLAIVGLLLAGCLLLLAAVSANDDDKKTEVKIKIGAKVHSAGGSQNRVAEYRPLQDNAMAAFLVSHYLDHQAVVADGRIEDQNDSEVHFQADFDRVLRLEGGYDRFLHRLEHDPLTNLQAVTPPKVTRYSDNNPTDRYGITRTEYKIGAEFNHPDAPWLTLEAGYRLERRNGMRQARTLSKCSNCHVTARSHPVDEGTQDYSVGARISAGNFALQYSYMGRLFKNNAGRPTVLYDDARHPSAGSPVFYDRVQFWSADGYLPFNTLSSTEKKTHSLTAVYNGQGAGTVGAGYVHSDSTNSFTNLGMTYNGLRGSYAVALSRRIALNLKGVYYSIGSDDYLVDVNEPVAVAGAYAGLTYREWRNDDAVTLDFNRRSWFDRTVYRFDADLLVRPLKKSGMTLSYRYEQVDRDNHEVAQGEHVTTRNRFRLNFSTRALEKLSARFNLIYEDIGNPFAGVDIAGMAAFNPPPVASPMVPGSIQYYQLYNSRMVDLSNMPDRDLELNGGLSYRPDKRLSFSAGFKWNDLKNGSLDYTEWSKERASMNASVWFAPAPQFYGMVTAYYITEKTHTAFIVPVFDG